MTAAATQAVPWRQRLASGRYLALLLSLALLMLGYPVLYALAEGKLLYTGLTTLVLLTGMWVTSRDGRFRPAALVLGAPLIVGAWAAAIVPEPSRLSIVYALHVIAPIFFGYTAVVIVSDLMRSPRVSNDSLFGAFSCYLLIGLFFGHLYCLVESVSPGSFKANEDLMGQLESEQQQNVLLAYFSLTTLTTLGYGDITPASDTTRTLATLEALIAQFFIVLLIGALVSRRVSEPRSSSS